MLVPSRRRHEEIRIGDQVVVKVLAVSGTQVVLGITAPTAVPIRRAEVPVLPPAAADGVVMSVDGLDAASGVPSVSGR